MEEEYINFGDELILKSDFLKAINDAKAYSATQPWSAARRGAFDAVSELAANRGILSTRKYTNPETGESMYYATFGGDPFDINTYDKNTRRGWLDYVNFVGRLAESLPTKKSIDEKKKKEEEERIAKLPTFDNNTFTNLLTGNISKGPLGGQKWDVNLWNTLDDTRDEKTGAVGIDNRKTELIKLLRDIDKNFKAKDYNWKDSPFLGADDFKARLAKAIGALESPELDDDTPALRELGLNYKDWFNNRTGEIYGEDKAGNPVTYGTYYRALLELKDAEAKVAADKLKLSLKLAYDNLLFLSRVTSPKMLGWNPVALKEKYKDSNSLLVALLNYAQRDIKTLTPDELSELHGAYRNLANQPIDSKLFNKIKNSSSGLYRNSAPNRFKKINGIDNLIWDSVAGQVIQINSRKQLEALLNLPLDLFARIQTLLEILNKQLQEYMNSTEGGFTPAELREVAALLFDLGAAVDPEGASSAVISQIASGIRDYNRASDPEGWTWGDTGWAALDHGLGLLSAIPIAGGWIKGGWAASKLAGYLPKIEKYIRLAGRAGSTYAMAANAPGALNTVEKIKKGEDLSLKDYQDLAYFFIGGLGHHQLNRGNRVERSAIKARGVETSNSLLNKAGITRTKAKSGNTTETTPTLKVKKTGEDGKVETKEIPIDAEKQKVLAKTKAEDLDAKAKELEIDIPEGYKINSKSTSTKTLSRENINRYRGKGNKEIFGTKTELSQTPSLKSDEEFEQYLSKHNNTWLKKFFNGSNRDIRRYDKYRGIKSIQQENSETPLSTPKVETNTSNHFAKNESSRIINEIENAYNPPSYKLKRLTKQISVKDGKSEINGKLINGSDYKVEYRGTKDTNGNWSTNNAKMVIIKDGTEIPIKGKTLGELKQNLGKWIKELNDKIKLSSNSILKKNDPNWKSFVESIRLLKRKGYLYRHGGTLTLDETIENFLKNNNI